MIPKHTFEKLLKIYDELSKSHHELSKEQNTIYKIGVFIDTMVDFREGVYQLVTAASDGCIAVSDIEKIRN